MVLRRQANSASRRGRITRDIDLRLEGIDAPEMNTDAGKASKAAVMEKLPVGTPITVHTYRDPGAYDRYTARVVVDGLVLNAWLVSQGLAVAKDYH